MLKKVSATKKVAHKTIYKTDDVVLYLGQVNWKKNNVRLLHLFCLCVQSLQNKEQQCLFDSQNNSALCSLDNWWPTEKSHRAKPPTRIVVPGGGKVTLLKSIC